MFPHMSMHISLTIDDQSYFIACFTYSAKKYGIIKSKIRFTFVIFSEKNSENLHIQHYPERRAAIKQTSRLRGLPAA